MMSGVSFREAGWCRDACVIIASVDVLPVIREGIFRIFFTNKLSIVQLFASYYFSCGRMVQCIFFV